MMGVLRKQSATINPEMLLKMFFLDCVDPNGRILYKKLENVSLDFIHFLSGREVDTAS